MIVSCDEPFVVGDEFGPITITGWASNETGSNSSSEYCYTCAPTDSPTDAPSDVPTVSPTDVPTYPCVPRDPCDACVNATTALTELSLQYTGSSVVSNSQPSSVVDGTTSDAVVDIAVFNNAGEMSRRLWLYSVVCCSCACACMYAPSSTIDDDSFECF
jgi:hypothetical protein